MTEVERGVRSFMNQGFFKKASGLVPIRHTPSTW